MSQLTVTGAFVNKTLLNRRKCRCRRQRRRDDWMARPKVADATKRRSPLPRWTAAGTVLRRSPWRTVQDFRRQRRAGRGCRLPDRRQEFVDWHKAGLMPKEVGAALVGPQYRDALKNSPTAAS